MPALRHAPQVRDLGRREKRRRSILAGRSIERGTGVGLGHRREVCIRGRSRADPHKTTCLNDPVEGRPIHDQTPDHGQCRGPPRLDHDRLAILTRPHVELAGGRVAVRAVRNSVDHSRVHAVNALAAVMIEGDRLFTVLDQPLVDLVE